MASLCGVMRSPAFFRVWVRVSSEFILFRIFLYLELLYIKNSIKSICILLGFIFLSELNIDKPGRSEHRQTLESPLTWL
jgi:hypothetical protein